MKDKIIEILQHVLTLIGGALVAKGLIDDVLLEQIIGGVLALGGSIWSVMVFVKNQKEIKALQQPKTAKKTKK